MENKKIRKSDRYGWEIKEEKLNLSQEEIDLLEKENKIEVERETKWLLMFNDWDIFTTTKFSKLKERVRKGIPDSWRGKIWSSLIQPEHKKLFNIEENLINELFLKEKQKCHEIIEADLLRTMPNCPEFSTFEIESLRKILYAYSNMDLELGYTQGMSFIAAILRHYMDEITAFYSFKTLMIDSRYKLRDYYLSGFPRLIESTKIWDIVLEDKYKNIYENFLEKKIHSLIYTPSWFLTIFLNVDFPINIRLRIFDRFVLYGFRSLLSFGLVIISRLKNELLSSNTDLILISLQKPFSIKKFHDWRYLLYKYDKLWIGERKYNEYIKKSGFLNF